MKSKRPVRAGRGIGYFVNDRPTIRVLLADDHARMRAGLRAVLEREGDIEVRAEAEDGDAAVRLAAELAPDVVVLDVRMPRLSGLDAARQIVASRPGARVVIVSASDDEWTVSESLRAGATGYVVKDWAFEELAAAVRTVAARKVYLSPRAGVAGSVGGSAQH